MQYAHPRQQTTTGDPENLETAFRKAFYVKDYP